MIATQRPAALRQDAGLIAFPSSQPQHDYLSLWHLLSLDAPTVATLWTVFIAYAAHVALGWATPAAMFLCVWMLYVADRLLDTRNLDTQEPMRDIRDLEARHIFHRHHQKEFVFMLFVAAVLMMTLLPRMETTTLRLYAALSALQAAYFFLIHIYFRSAARLPKEFAVGVFFAAAVFVPVIGHMTILRLLPCGVAFAALCTLNCLYIYAWEHPGERNYAHASTRFAIAHLPAITAVLCCLESGLYCLDIHLRAISAALWLSTVALCALHASRSKLSRIHLRAAADIALLTPLLLLHALR